MSVFAGNEKYNGDIMNKSDLKALAAIIVIALAFIAMTLVMHP
ncbi:MAG: hypothetical protein AABX14_01745 [Candidatus Aenigmatarchaeota archaeon]